MKDLDIQQLSTPPFPFSSLKHTRKLTKAFKFPRQNGMTSLIFYFIVRFLSDWEPCFFSAQ